MLVPKGDQEKKIAAKSVYLLLLLLQAHPNMKIVVIKEVQQFLIRPNVALRSQYYAITFLNQIVLRSGGADESSANLLIDVYFGVFEGLIGTESHREKGKDLETKQKNRWRDGKKDAKPQKVIKSNANEFEGLNAKMLSGLLTGVNRALPYAKVEDDS
jgi:ribosome biogenesis protein MAK21